MSKVKFIPLMTKLHRWASYLLFIPISFWIVGGTFMSWVPIELVRSEHTVPHHNEAKAYLDEGVMPRLIEAGLLKGSISIVADNVAGEAVVKLRNGLGHTDLYRQSDLAKLSPINENLARNIASYGYAPTDEIIDATYITANAPIEYRSALPVWRVEMADGTTLYIKPDTGRIVARRSDVWRAFDFFWMLHTLDFETRDDINNPLILTFSALAALFLVTGLILTGQRAWIAWRFRG